MFIVKVYYMCDIMCMNCSNFVNIIAYCINAYTYVTCIKQIYNYYNFYWSGMRHLKYNTINNGTF